MYLRTEREITILQKYQQRQKYLQYKKKTVLKEIKVNYSTIKNNFSVEIHELLRSKIQEFIWYHQNNWEHRLFSMHAFIILTEICRLFYRLPEPSTANLFIYTSDPCKYVYEIFHISDFRYYLETSPYTIEFI